MARNAGNIHVPNLDPKFVARRNPDGNWLLARFVENVEHLNQLASKMPQEVPWKIRTAEQFETEFNLLGGSSQPEVLELFWIDMFAQIRAFGLTSAWRLMELVSSAVWAVRRDDPICAAIMARAALETVASYAWFGTRVRPALETLVRDYDFGIVEDLEEELLKTLFASRKDDAEDFYRPTNIVSIIQKITNKIPHQNEVGPCYETLCEVAHPNFLGRSIYLSEDDGQLLISRKRGPSIENVDRATLLALSWASGTFPISLTALQEAAGRLIRHFNIDPRRIV